MGKENKDSLIFDSTRFYTPKEEITRQGGTAPAVGTFLDASDGYANNGMVIGFHHTPSGKNVYFKAFITSFNESYNSDWSTEVVYGRADPIAMFKNTTRNITLAFKIPAASISEAYENLANVGILAQFLYPFYTGIGTDATTIAQSPLVRMKVMNLLADQSKGTNGKKFKDFLASGSSSSFSASKGLLGYITSVAINHNLETEEAGVLETGQGVILPKLIDVTVDFAAIHEHTLGWTASDDSSDPKFAHPSFPYGLDLEGSSGDPDTLKEKITTIMKDAEAEALRRAQDAAAAEAFANSPEGITERLVGDQARSDSARADVSKLFAGISGNTIDAGFNPETATDKQTAQLTERASIEYSEAVEEASRFDEYGLTEEDWQDM